MQERQVDMISDPGLTLTVYAAEPGSTAAQALDLLASWQATETAESIAAAAPPSSAPGRRTTESVPDHGRS